MKESVGQQLSSVHSDTAGDSNQEETTRVVSLVPNITELAFAVGAGKQVVGVSDYCRYPREAMDRPAVGGLVNPSLEGVLALRPTVVLLYRSQADFAGRLKRLGIRSELFQVDSLADLFAATERVGELTGRRTEAAGMVREIKAGLDAVRHDTGTSSSTNIAGDSRVSGVIIVSRDPSGLRNLYQAGAGNFLGELFEIAGGELAVKGGADLSLEDMIRANPDVIIDMSGSASGGGEGRNGVGNDAAVKGKIVRDVGPWGLLSTVEAVKRGQVYRWDDAHATLLGPSVVETAKRMSEILWGREPN